MSPMATARTETEPGRFLLPAFGPVPARKPSRPAISFNRCRGCFELTQVAELTNNRCVTCNSLYDDGTKFRMQSNRRSY